MKAYIDRIEDGKAVLMVGSYGELVIPVKDFEFKVCEGMHISMDLKIDVRSQKKTLEAVKNLQVKLLNRSRRK